eukprot:m.264568 g.264568  ORF g.264568 m.264568 type:complete len:73 (-) comp16025_c0_seq4:37-255(-)
MLLTPNLRRHYESSVFWCSMCLLPLFLVLTLLTDKTLPVSFSVLQLLLFHGDCLVSSSRVWSQLDIHIGSTS